MGSSSQSLNISFDELCFISTLLTIEFVLKAYKFSSLVAFKCIFLLSPFLQLNKNGNLVDFHVYEIMRKILKTQIKTVINLNHYDVMSLSINVLLGNDYIHSKAVCFNVHAKLLGKMFQSVCCWSL